MRQEMRWERHFVPFTGKLSLLILLGLFIGAGRRLARSSTA